MFKEEERPGRDEVIINVYVESSRIRSRHRNDPIKIINPNPSSIKPRSAKTRGYDRRAQLLAYAQELRHGNAQNLELPMKNPRPKRKKWTWSLTMTPIKKPFHQCFHRPSGQWRYERIVTEEYNGCEGSCSQQRFRPRKTNERRTSHFCKRLKGFLKELSSVWHCNK